MQFNPPLNEAQPSVIRNWLIFLAALLILRAVMGLLAAGQIFTAYHMGHFYPIRIAYPNYGILHGFIYAVMCIIVLLKLDTLGTLIAKSSHRYLSLGLFATGLSLLFGAIHGGFINGNLGIVTEAEHLHDVALNANAMQVFATHAARVSGQLTPPYLAAHTLSHPSLSLVYWQFMVNHFPPMVFSLANVTILSLAFMVVCWSLQKQYPRLNAVQLTLACMVTPALLVYGRGDDAVYYALAAAIMAISAVAFAENRYGLSLLVGVLLAIAMNFSYASLILLAALASFNTNATLAQMFSYLRRVVPHVLVIVASAASVLTLMQHYLGYHYFQEFFACVHHSASNNIVAMLRQGDYMSVINARLMTLADILLFGGPLFLYVFYCLVRRCNRHVLQWGIKNIALTVCLLVLMINSNGPGEIARPWGNLYLLIGIVWFTELLSRENEATRWWLIRTQFLWALLLQIPLNFGW